ncbi:LysE family translocator [Methylocapsa sp. S129]|uniref:LysE family translocator n=1 Tax=Methylocapsa sp. S129 TaxID=1641869 RepID=UPI00131A64E9|nr:LysE family transporter [Methylocapsa sp. S129]
MSIALSLLSVAALWTLAVVTPGPNFLVIARLAVGQSRAAGLRAVIGIGAGTAIWGAAGFFGVHALFTAAPWMYAGLKLLGGAYLVFLGSRLLWQSRRPAANEREKADRPRSLSPFQLGLVTNLANPKSALFVASLFATAMPNHPPVALGLAAIAIMVALSISWYALVACLFTTRRIAAAYEHGRLWVDRVAGAIFVLFGARLIASS